MTIVVTIMVVVAVAMAAEVFIVDGMRPPISVVPFPFMEARGAPGIEPDPHMVRPEIIIVAANDADIFNAVVHICVRNRLHDDYWRRRRGGHNSYRRSGNGDLHVHIRTCYQ